MAKVRNIALVVIAFAIIFSAFITRGLSAAGVTWFEDVGMVAKSSSLEGREYAGRPTLAVSTFMSGELQDQTESYLADSMPFRDSGVLLSAALQRLSISQGAALVGFDVYPTKFGGSFLHVASQNAVTSTPVEYNSTIEANLRTFAEGVAAQAAQYPDKTFVVYVVGGYQNPAVNPAYEYIADAFTPDVAEDVFAGIFNGQENIKLMGSRYSSATDYYRDFYRSDHHWNIRGALVAYNQMATAVNLAPVDIDSLHEVTLSQGYVFNGATSRPGLDLVSDMPVDYDVDYSSVSYYVGSTLVHGNSGFDTSQKGAQYTFYDGFYNNIPDGTIFGPGSGQALLISNSYGGAIQRQLALNYATMEKSTALWPGYSGSNFAELLAKSDAQTIFFVANPSDFSNMSENLPHFFDK